MRYPFRITLTVSLLLCFAQYAFPLQIVQERGGKVKVIEYDDGSWELMVREKPFFIKGVIFTPVKIGEDPNTATMRDWMYYDDDRNGKNDIAYQTWVDANKNNRRDPGEKEQGDFALLKEMGANTIRLYHIASDNHILGSIYKDNPSTSLQFNHSVNKVLLRKLYSDYGVMTIMGNFLGSWTIGSGAAWEEGTDYNNPKHRENIKKSVKAMVLDNKDEDYVLLWLLGNENNIADWSRCNAKQNPRAYAEFIGELADMIHELDPDHPVAVCDGDDAGRMLKYYAQYAPGLDIIAYNSYRGRGGFGGIWKDVKNNFDRPMFISEYGMFAYQTHSGENELLQLDYIKKYWQDIVSNSCYYYRENKKGEANSLGGVIFDWVDRWYMDGTPYKHNGSQRRSVYSPDGFQHEEWFGIVSMGNGNPLMRQKRKAYQYLEETWNKNVPSF